MNQVLILPIAIEHIAMGNVEQHSKTFSVDLNVCHFFKIFNFYTPCLITHHRYRRDFLTIDDETSVSGTNSQGCGSISQKNRDPILISLSQCSYCDMIAVFSFYI
jgi:hypothetical protein